LYQLLSWLHEASLQNILGDYESILLKFIFEKKNNKLLQYLNTNIY
jgi:hypothetical protein